MASSFVLCLCLFLHCLVVICVLMLYCFAMLLLLLGASWRRPAAGRRLQWVTNRHVSYHRSLLPVPRLTWKLCMICMYVCIYIYIYIHLHIHIHVYIYIERERDREREIGYRI